MPNFAYTTYIFRTGNNLPKAYNSLKDFHNKILSSEERWRYGIDRYGNRYSSYYYLTSEVMIEEEYYKESNGLFNFDCSYTDNGIQKPKRGFITSVSDIQLVQGPNSSVHFQFELKTDDAWVTNASFFKQLLKQHYGDDITFTYYANEEGVGHCYTTDPEYAGAYHMWIDTAPFTNSNFENRYNTLDTDADVCLDTIKTFYPDIKNTNTVEEACAEIETLYGPEFVWARKYELVSDNYTEQFDCMF